MSVSIAVPYGSAPLRGTPRSAEAVDYLGLLRGPRRRWWRPLACLVLWAGLYVPLLLLTVVPTIAYGWASGVPDLGLWLDAVADPADNGPGSFLVGNLAIIAGIPAALLSTLIVYRVDPGYLLSVLGRIRWRWLLRSVLAVTPVWVIYLGVSGVLDPPASVRPGAWLELALLVVVLTPLQAAAEEVVFRGWLAQNVGSWIRSPVVRLVVTATVTAALFAAAHGSPDPWVLADIAIFAVTCSLLTWRTGGLESAIALHAVNNLGTAALTLAIGGWDEAFVSEGTTGSPVGVAVSLGVHGVALAVLWWQARRADLDPLYRPC